METKSPMQVVRTTPRNNDRLLARVSSLPLLRTPQPPAEYLPSARDTAARPEAAQEVIAAAVVAELTLWSEAYIEQFGRDVPHPGDLAEAFTMADGWSRETQKAQAWLAYASMQRATAWEVVMTLVGELSGAFELARLRDIELALRFPALSRFFAAQEQRERSAAREEARARRAKPKEDVATAPSQG